MRNVRIAPEELKQKLEAGEDAIITQIKLQQALHTETITQNNIREGS